MGNINMHDISCNYNLCLDDLYEIDWFSENNWDIHISNEEYRKKISIKKGKIILSDMNNINILLKKKININEKNIKKILLPLFFNFQSKCEFNILINLSNENTENLVVDEINNITNSLFTFNIKCIDDKIYINDFIFNNNDKNLLNILFNFEYKNILSSTIDFIQNNIQNEDKINHINKKNNLYYDNNYIFLCIIIQIHKLDSNEYIKLNL
jgi:hypothetical protein